MACFRGLGKISYLKNINIISVINDPQFVHININNTLPIIHTHARIIGDVIAPIELSANNDSNTYPTLFHSWRPTLETSFKPVHKKASISMETT